jgi:hypothetical protein
VGGGGEAKDNGKVKERSVYWCGVRSCALRDRNGRFADVFCFSF